MNKKSIFEEFLSHIREKYNLTIQWNNKTKVEELFNNVATKKKNLNVKKDYVKKFKHPIVISTKPIFISKETRENLFESRTMTKSAQTEVYNPLKNEFEMVDNFYLSDKTFIGENKDQYLGGQSLYSTKETYSFIKRDNLSEKEYSDIINSYMNDVNITKTYIGEIEKIRKIIDEKDYYLIQCLSSFKNKSSNIGDHFIICNHLIENKIKEYKNFEIISQKYKKCLDEGNYETVVQYINETTLILQPVVTNIADKTITAINTIL